MIQKKPAIPITSDFLRVQFLLIKICCSISSAAGRIESTCLSLLPSEVLNLQPGREHVDGTPVGGDVKCSYGRRLGRGCCASSVTITPSRAHLYGWKSSCEGSFHMSYSDVLLS